MTNQVVQLSTTESVATVTLNRPEVLNTLNLSTGEALVRAIHPARTMTTSVLYSLQELVEGFCAGGDMKAAWEHHRREGTSVTSFVI